MGLTLLEKLGIAYTVVGCLVTLYVLYGELSDPHGYAEAWRAGLFAVGCGIGWMLLAAWMACVFGPLVVERRRQ